MKCAACGHANPEDATLCGKCGESLDEAGETGFRPPATSSDDSSQTAVRPAPPKPFDDEAATGMRPPSGADFDDSSETGVRPPPSDFDDSSVTGVRPPTAGDFDDSSATGVRPTPSPTGLSSPGTYAGSGATGAIPTYQSFGNRYEILELLGEGGMGRVYKAWDRELEKVIALKTIRGEQASNPEVLKRFKQELLLARKITHKNVIRIHDMGEAGGVRFFTMEYIPGDSLKERIEKRGRIPVEQAVPMAKQILGALEEAHEQGVVHRDLKPQNIMIDQEGMLHIMDFGIARSAQDTHGMTATGTVMGTPDYMSPEQVKGEKAGAPSDLFSFGVILYEMLTGTLPYQADTTAAKVMMRLNKKPKLPREIDPQIPKYLESVILKCLEVDGDLRYRTAAEILEDIEREQVDRSPIARLQRTLVRRRGTVAAAAVLAAAIGTAAYFAVKAGSAPAPVEQPTMLAVVPFNNASGDPSLDWLGPNLAEILVTELGQSSQFQTVSTDRVRQILADLRIPVGAKLEPATVTRLAEFSNAETIISGQFLKLGEQIRIDATLQDLEEQRTVALKVEAAGESELLGAIATLAQSVQENLGLSRDAIEEMRARSLRPSSDSLQALRLYNEGLELSRVGDYLEARNRFEAAVDEDPGFALAYSNLGQTAAALGYREEAERFSRRAVELGQQLPAQERYLILAQQARVLNDHPKAIESYQNLLEVMPDDPDIHFSMAGLYEETGDLEQAREHITQVLNRDPNRLDALFTKGRIEIQLGDSDSALQNLNQALTLAIRLDNNVARGTVLNLMGMAYKQLDRLDDALRYYQEALEIRREVGDKGGAAVTLKELASVEQRMGDLDEALAGYQESLALRQEIGDQAAAGATLLDIGNLYNDRGEHERAIELYKESLRVQREIGDEAHEAICLNNIGAVYLNAGQYEEALTYLELALGFREKAGNPIDLSETLHNVAETYLKMGRYDEALANYLRSLELSRTAGDQFGAAIESYSLGTAFGYQGRYGAALEAKVEALTIFRDLGEGGFWLGEILRGYGQSLAEVGRFDEAQEVLNEALDVARDLENQTLIAQALDARGDLLFYGGDSPAARRSYQESLTEAERTGDQSLAFLPKMNLARLDLLDGRTESALSAFESLEGEADALGLEYESAESSLCLAEALLERNDYDQAQERLEQVLRESERSGLRVLLARSHVLLGRLHRLSGDDTESARYYQEALRVLNEMQEESGSEAFLNRTDLKRLHDEASS